MGIKLSWEDSDKMVLRQACEGRWTIDDFRHAVDTTYKLLKGLSHTVHIIVDMTKSAGTPSNILSAGRYAEQRIAKNQGMVVVVGADEFTRTVLKMAKRIAPQATSKGTHVESLDEARDLISSITTSIA